MLITDRVSTANMTVCTCVCVYVWCCWLQVTFMTHHEWCEWLDSATVTKKKILIRTKEFWESRCNWGVGWKVSRYLYIRVEYWNKLSKQVLSAGTVDTFKKRLDISIGEENRWWVLGTQKLPCLGQLAFCSLLIFLFVSIITWNGWNMVFSGSSRPRMLLCPDAWVKVVNTMLEKLNTRYVREHL